MLKGKSILRDIRYGMDMLWKQNTVFFGID